MKKTSKAMTRAEYEEHLALEVRRAQMLADLETDPQKKGESQRRARGLNWLLRRVRHADRGGVETADSRGFIDIPGQKKIID